MHNKWSPSWVASDKISVGPELTNDQPTGSGWCCSGSGWVQSLPGLLSSEGLTGTGGLNIQSCSLLGLAVRCWLLSVPLPRGGWWGALHWAAEYFAHMVAGFPQSRQSKRQHGRCNTHNPLLWECVNCYLYTDESWFSVWGDCAEVQTERGTGHGGHWRGCVPWWRIKGNKESRETPCLLTPAPQGAEACELDKWGQLGKGERNC